MSVRRVRVDAYVEHGEGGSIKFALFHPSDRIREVVPNHGGLVTIDVLSTLDLEAEERERALLRARSQREDGGS